ncbi:MAG: hypothetical protein IJM58_01235 [Muribaculaceae bacterium]|nr:hypothetical protein [Muribaculaceae bacterium]
MDSIVNKINIASTTRYKLSGALWKDFTREQQEATLKSCLYLIDADGVVTEEEKNHCVLMCFTADHINMHQLLDHAYVMKADEMFSIISAMSKSQKNTVLYHWVQLIYASKGIEIVDDYMRCKNLFNIDNYPNEKPWFIELAHRCNIDVSPFLAGTIEIA